MNLYRFSKYLLALVLLPLIGFVSPVVTHAQTPVTSGINLNVSPVFINLVTDPGKPVSSEVKVRNNNNQTEHLKVSLAKFTTGKDGNPVISDITSDDEFRKWITFSEDTFSLASNETKTIKFTINPPADASLGYYYAIVIGRVSEGNTGGQKAVVAGSPAIPVLLEVRSPNAKRELQVVDFKPDHLFYEYLPATFSVTVKNTGNVHVVPTGDIFIDSPQKQNLVNLTVNEGRGNVLPQTERTFTAVWNDGFVTRVPKMENGQVVTGKDGKPVMQTKWDFSKADKFWIGKYTADMLLVYDNGERDIPVEAKVSFWIIPWKILLGVGVVIVLILLGLWSIISTNLNRVRKHSHG